MISLFEQLKWIEGAIEKHARERLKEPAADSRSDFEVMKEIRISLERLQAQEKLLNLSAANAVQGNTPQNIK